MRILLTAAVLVSLAGCVGLPPMYSGGASPPSNYLVRKGDTLYSIAFRYGLDYRSLARINSIRPPYTIYLQQVIKLRGSARVPLRDSGPAKKSTSRNKAQTVSKLAIKAPTAPVSEWRWPAKGKVISPYSLKNPVNKGIDIAGKRGEDVLAAAHGVVVYAGGNLRGYGKLVIIKHNDNFLSAYGNNSSMLVKEGASVEAGKAIARIGATAANVEMLHFEIRRDGKPVDPLGYLPAR
jgi:lipoprotein NlpD